MFSRLRANVEHQIAAANAAAVLASSDDTDADVSALSGSRSGANSLATVEHVLMKVSMLAEAVRIDPTLSRAPSAARLVAKSSSAALLPPAAAAGGDRRSRLLRQPGLRPFKSLSMAALQQPPPEVLQSLLASSRVHAAKASAAESTVSPSNAGDASHPSKSPIHADLFSMDSYFSADVLKNDVTWAGEPRSTTETFLPAADGAPLGLLDSARVEPDTTGAVSDSETPWWFVASGPASSVPTLGESVTKHPAVASAGSGGQAASTDLVRLKNRVATICGLGMSPPEIRRLYDPGNGADDPNAAAITASANSAVADELNRMNAPLVAAAGALLEARRARADEARIRVPNSEYAPRRRPHVVSVGATSSRTLTLPSATDSRGRLASTSTVRALPGSATASVSLPGPAMPCDAVRLPLGAAAGGGGAGGKGGDDVDRANESRRQTVLAAIVASTGGAQVGAAEAAEEEARREHALLLAKGAGKWGAGIPPPLCGSAAVDATYIAATAAATSAALAASADITIGAGEAASSAPAAAAAAAAAAAVEPVSAIGGSSLPDWLRTRADYKKVEAAAEAQMRRRAAHKPLTAPPTSRPPPASVAGNAAAAATGTSHEGEEEADAAAVAGAGGMVLVRRALETPGNARGAKDVDVLARWLHGQAQFGALGPLQLAAVARSVVGDALPSGARMAPTAESVYVVLAEQLQVTQGDGSVRLVGPGDSLGSRAWWSSMSQQLGRQLEDHASASAGGSSGAAQSVSKLGRRLSLIISSAVHSAGGEDAARMQGASLQLLHTSRRADSAAAAVHPGSAEHPLKEKPRLAFKKPVAAGASQQSRGGMRSAAASGSASDRSAPARSLPKPPVRRHSVASVASTEAGRRTRGRRCSAPDVISAGSKHLLSASCATYSQSVALGTARSSGSASGQLALVADGTVVAAMSDAATSAEQQRIMFDTLARMRGGSNAGVAPFGMDGSGTPIEASGRSDETSSPGEVGRGRTGLTADKCTLQLPKLPLPTSGRESARAFDTTCVARAITAQEVIAAQAFMTLAARAAALGQTLPLPPRAPFQVASLPSSAQPQVSARARDISFSRDVRGGRDISNAGAALLTVPAAAAKLLAGWSRKDISRAAALHPNDVLSGAVLVRLGLGEYHETLVAHRRAAVADTLRYLHTESAHFSGWGATRLAALSRALEPRAFATGATLFRQGDVADSLCLLRSGAVDVYRRALAVDRDVFPTGRQAWSRQTQITPTLVHVETLQPGQFFGFEALAWHATLVELDAKSRKARRGNSVKSRAECGTEPSPRRAPAPTLAADRVATFQPTATTEAALRLRGVVVRQPTLHESYFDRVLHSAATPVASTASGRLARAPPILEEPRNILSPSVHATGVMPTPTSLPLITNTTASDAIFDSLPSLHSVAASPAQSDHSPRAASASLSSSLPAGATAMPPVREISVVASTACSVLFLRPEHIQLLQHRGLMTLLQEQAAATRVALDDTSLLARRREAQRISRAVNELKSSAYGPRYSRSVQQGIVLVPDTEPVPSLRMSSVPITEASFNAHEETKRRRIGKMAQNPAIAPHLRSGGNDEARARIGHENFDVLALRRSLSFASGCSTISLSGHSEVGSFYTQPLTERDPPSASVRVQETATEVWHERLAKKRPLHASGAKGKGAVAAESAASSGGSFTGTFGTSNSTLGRASFGDLPSAALLKVRVPLPLYHALSATSTRPLAMISSHSIDSLHPRVLYKLPPLPESHPELAHKCPMSLLIDSAAAADADAGGTSDGPPLLTTAAASAPVVAVTKMACLHDRLQHVDKSAALTIGGTRVRDAQKHASEVAESGGVLRGAANVAPKTILALQPASADPFERSREELVIAADKRASSVLAAMVEETSLAQASAGATGDSSLPSFWPPEVPRPSERRPETPRADKRTTTSKPTLGLPTEYVNSRSAAPSMHIALAHQAASPPSSAVPRELRWDGANVRLGGQHKSHVLGTRTETSGASGYWAIPSSSTTEAARSDEDAARACVPLRPDLASNTSSSRASWLYKSGSSASLTATQAAASLMGMPAGLSALRNSLLSLNPEAPAKGELN